MSRFPIRIGSCRCGKPRGHADPCHGELPEPEVIRTESLTGTPWHWMRDELVDRFGEELGNWLAKRMATHIRGKECLSHFSLVEKPRGIARVARRLAPKAWAAVDRHEEIRRDGCCGSFDTELHHYKSGRRFLFGFNYGH